MVAGRSSEIRCAATVLVTVLLLLVAAGAAGAQGPSISQSLSKNPRWPAGRPRRTQTCRFP